MAKKQESTDVAVAEAPRPGYGLILGGPTGLASQIPEHLRVAAGEGTEEVRKYLRPGRLKVMQSNRTSIFSDFQEGSVIVTPVNMLLAENDVPFHFIPLLFFSEWCTVNPFQMKDKLPMIRAQSFDPGSDIAIKSRDKDKRTEKCPENDKFMIKHKQYFNFVCWLALQEELSRIPVLLTFSGGEYARGQRLCDMISMKSQQVPLWGQVYEGRVNPKKRTSEGGEWYGIDVSSPTVEGVSPFVMDPGEAQALQQAHRDLKAKHAERLLVTDHEEEEAEAQAAETSGESKF